MDDSSKKTNRFTAFGTILLTYIIVKIVYKLIGFHYDFSDGLVNFKLLIDIALWVFIYFPVNYLLKNIFSGRTV